MVSLLAEVIANDRPVFMRFEGRFYVPILQEISEEELGGVFATQADFRDEAVLELIGRDAESFLIWPLVRFSYDTINYQAKSAAPAPPNGQNWLGTDDQGRDVLARVIYGVRISLLFGLALSAASLVLAVVIGAVQGFFGGKIDILGQRFIEIWAAMPVLFLLIILSAIITPGFFSLLGLMLLFSWISLSGMVRAEFLRLKNLDFVMAARAMKASNFRIMFKHILPNAAPIIIANLAFLVSGSIVTLTSLDFLGLGMAAGSPSLGELLAQGKNNIAAWHLGAVGFAVIAVILTALVFVGEGVRDVVDSRR